MWEHLLPTHAFHPEPTIPALRVTKVAYKIRFLIEELINVEVKVNGRPPSLSCSFSFGSWGLWSGVLMGLGKLVDEASFTDYYETCA